MIKYTHAIVYEKRKGKKEEDPVELVEYACSKEHAEAIAYQLLSTGAKNISLVKLEEPMFVEDN
jgi:hypothetical protein